MKYLITTVFFISLSFTYCPREKYYWDRVEVIFTGTAGEVATDSTYYMELKTVFKGWFLHSEAELNVKSKVIEPGIEYLVYGTAGRGEGRVTVAKLVQLNEAGEELNRLNHTVPCTLRINSEGACYRIKVPVCGCNRVTYANSCEASKAGVQVYSFGECGK